MRNNIKLKAMKTDVFSGFRRVMIMAGVIFLASSLQLPGNGPVAAPYSPGMVPVDTSALKPLSLAVTFVYIITMLIEKRTSESGSVTWYHLTSPLLVALAMASELSSVPELRFYTVLRLAGGMLRLIATINYIIFAISEYLSRERIIIGQIELDDLLYKDSLTGCLNRRNLDRFRSDPESLADSFYMFRPQGGRQGLLILRFLHPPRAAC